MLEIENLSYQINGRWLLREIRASFRPGELSVILGPNGSGKSTFVKLTAGRAADFEGRVLYDGHDLRSYNKRSLAKKRAVLSQHAPVAFSMLVEEVVMAGRYPHFDSLPSRADCNICDQAIDWLELGDLRGRDYLSLSGGEQQRTQLARVLAQLWDKPPTGERYLLLDEPVSSLDIRHQQQLLSIVKRLTGDGFCVVAVLHDINLALEFAHQVLLFKDGALRYSGLPAAVITEESLAAIYDTPMAVIRNPLTGHPLAVPRR